MPVGSIVVVKERTIWSFRDVNGQWVKYATPTRIPAKEAVVVGSHESPSGLIVHLDGGEWIPFTEVEWLPKDQ